MKDAILAALERAKVYPALPEQIEQHNRVIAQLWAHGLISQEDARSAEYKPVTIEVGRFTVIAEWRFDGDWGKRWGFDTPYEMVGSPEDEAFEVAWDAVGSCPEDEGYVEDIRRELAREGVGDEREDEVSASVRSGYIGVEQTMSFLKGKGVGDEREDAADEFDPYEAVECPKCGDIYEPHMDGGCPSCAARG